jgi:DNA topoisomerase 2-associated protein PAT1
MEEIEAEMSRAAIAVPPMPSQPKVLSLAEIEAEMMRGAVPSPLQHATPTPPHQPTPPPVQQPQPHVSQQALLDSMFPGLGSAGPIGGTGPMYNQAPPRPGPSPEELEAIRARIKDKINQMSKYNNLMGSSDKDFITRIQLSQLATEDPYASDFYAQVFSALSRSRMAAAGAGPGGPGMDGPTVVQVAPGVAFGVGAAGAAGNRFGKMGSATMQKLSTQVKKLVESKKERGMGSGES